MEQQLLTGAVLLLASIVFSKASGRLGLPALIVFLIVGILAGPDGVGHVTFADPHWTELIATIALVFILFSGGLETEWADLKPVLSRGILLATVGLVINAFIVALAMRLLFSVTWEVGLLFGSIIGCTDAAAVFTVLRSNATSLRNGLGPTAELESAANDPMAVFLSLALIGTIKDPSQPLWGILPLFFLQMGVGAIVGWLMGRISPWVINRLNLEHQGLYSPLTIALAVLTYGIAAVLGGSGFLAAYVCGIMMNRERFLHKRSLIRFHAGFAWLLQIMMFVTLGLLLHPAKLGPIVPRGIVLSVFIIFIARPLSVFLTLMFANLTWREKLMTSWLGLRGAVPIILATLVYYSGISDAELLFNLVFFVVVLSLAVQGTTLPLMTKWLKVAEPTPVKELLKFESGAVLTESGSMQEIVVPTDSELCGRSVMSLGLDSESYVLLLHRDGGTIVPTGRTRIEGGDVLLLLAPIEDYEKVRQLAGPRSEQED